MWQWFYFLLSLILGCFFLHDNVDRENKENASRWPLPPGVSRSCFSGTFLNRLSYKRITFFLNLDFTVSFLFRYLYGNINKKESLFLKRQYFHIFPLQKNLQCTMYHMYQCTMYQCTICTSAQCTICTRAPCTNVPCVSVHNVPYVPVHHVPMYHMYPCTMYQCTICISAPCTICTRQTITAGLNYLFIYWRASF